MAAAKMSEDQVRGFLASWLGVMLDGVDSFIYALVLVPAMKEILPQSGIEATAGNLGYFGSILFSMFLIGWGLAFLWGPLADRFGRVRCLMLAILCYSLFTLLGCFAHNIWELAIYRLLAGFGVGGEFVGAATFVAETLPEKRRVWGAGVFNSAYYVGSFVAAGLNYVVGARYGWRAMFLMGGLPALLIAWIRSNVREPDRWRLRRQTTGGWRARDSFFALFNRQYRRVTILNCVLWMVSMIGLWAGSVYAPGAVTQVAVRDGYSDADAARIASRASMLLATGTIIGCLCMPLLANRIGRRGALSVFFMLMTVSISSGFGYAFYLPGHALQTFLPCLFLVGIGGGNFSVYWVWMPEQYHTECRGSALAFASCFGRFVAAGATFLVGIGISRFGSIGAPVALTSIAFALGLLVIPFTRETMGQPLPD